MKAFKKFMNRSKEDKSAESVQESVPNKAKKGLINFRRKSSSSHSQGIENLGLGQSTSFDDDDDLASSKTKSSDTVPLSVCGYVVDLSKKLPESFTKLHKACWAGNEEKVAILTSGNKSLDVNAQDDELRTPLHLAAARGLEKIVKHLCKHQPNYALKDNKGRTALIKAVEGHHFGCVSSLLDAGADPNLSDNDGDTCLHVALRQNFSDIALSLLQREVDFDSANLEGQTPLHLAANCKQLGVVRKLISLGAALNPQDGRKRTPLMMAARSGSLPVVSYLLDNGADFNEKDSDSRTALDVAEQEGHRDVAEVIRSFGKLQPESENLAEVESVPETDLTKATKQSENNNDLDNLSWNDSSSSGGRGSPVAPAIKSDSAILTKADTKSGKSKTDLDKNPALRKLSDFMADLGMSDISDDENSSNDSANERAYEADFDFTKKLSSMAERVENKMADKPSPKVNLEDSKTKENYLSKTKNDDEDENGSWSDSDASLPDPKVSPTRRLEPENVLTFDKNKELVEGKESEFNNEIDTESGPIKPPRGRKVSSSKSASSSSNSGGNTPRKRAALLSMNDSPKINEDASLRATVEARKPSISSFDSSVASFDGATRKITVGDPEPFNTLNVKHTEIEKRHSSISSFDSSHSVDIETTGQHESDNLVVDGPSENRPDDGASNVKTDVVKRRQSSVSSFDSHSVANESTGQHDIGRETGPTVDESIVLKPDVVKRRQSSFDSSHSVANVTTGQHESAIDIGRETGRMVDESIVLKPDVVKRRQSSVSSFDSSHSVGNVTTGQHESAIDIGRETGPMVDESVVLKPDVVKRRQSSISSFDSGSMAASTAKNSIHPEAEVESPKMVSTFVDNAPLGSGSNLSKDSTLFQKEETKPAVDIELSLKIEDDFNTDTDSVEGSNSELKLDLQSDAKSFGSKETLADGTLGRISTLQGVDEIWVENAVISVPDELLSQSPDLELDSPKDLDESVPLKNVQEATELKVLGLIDDESANAISNSSQIQSKLAPLKKLEKVEGHRLDVILKKTSTQGDEIGEDQAVGQTVLNEENLVNNSEDGDILPQNLERNSSENSQDKLRQDANLVSKETFVLDQLTRKTSLIEDSQSEAHALNKVFPTMQEEKSSWRPQVAKALPLNPDRGHHHKAYVDESRCLFKETIDENCVYNSYSESESNGSAKAKVANAERMRATLRRRHTYDNLNLKPKTSEIPDVERRRETGAENSSSSTTSDNLVADKIDFFNSEERAMTSSSRRNSLVRNQFRFNHRAKSVDFGEVSQKLNASLMAKRRVSTDFRIGSCEDIKPPLTKSSTISSLDESAHHSIDEDEYLEEYQDQDDSFHVSRNPMGDDVDEPAHPEDEVFSRTALAKPTLYNVVVDLLRNRANSVTEETQTRKVQEGQRASINFDSDSSPTVSDSEDNEGKNGDDKTVHGSDSEPSLSDDPLKKDIKISSASFSPGTDLTDVHSLLAKCRLALTKEEGRKKIYFRKLKHVQKTLNEFKEKHESVLESKNDLEKELLDIRNEMVTLRYQLKEEKDENCTNQMILDKMKDELKKSGSHDADSSLRESLRQELDLKNELIADLNSKVESFQFENESLKKDVENLKTERVRLNEKNRDDLCVIKDKEDLLEKELGDIKLENEKLKLEKSELTRSLNELRNDSKMKISDLERQLLNYERQKESSFSKAMDDAKDLGLKVVDVTDKISRSFHENEKLKEKLESFSETILSKLNSIVAETNSLSEQLSEQKELFSKFEQRTHSGMLAKIDEKSENLCQKIMELSSKMESIPAALDQDQDEDKETEGFSALMAETKEHFNQSISKIEDNLVGIIEEQSQFLRNLEKRVNDLTEKIISVKEEHESQTFIEAPILKETMNQRNYVAATNNSECGEQRVAVVDPETVRELNSGIESLRDKIDSIFVVLNEKESRPTRETEVNPSSASDEMPLTKELRKLEKDNVEIVNQHRHLLEKFSIQSEEIAKLREELRRMKESAHNDTTKAINYEMTLQTITRQRDELDSRLDKEKELNRKLMEESRTFLVEFNTLREYLRDIQRNTSSNNNNPRSFQNGENPAANGDLKEKLHDLKYQVDFLQHKIDVDKELRQKNGGGGGGEETRFNSLKMDVYALKNEQLSKLNAIESTIDDLRRINLQEIQRPEKYFAWYKDVLSLSNGGSPFARSMSLGNPTEDTFSNARHKIMDDVINLRSSLRVNKCQCEKLLKENEFSYVTPGISTNGQSDFCPEKICNNLCRSSHSQPKRKFEDFRRTDLKLNNYASSTKDNTLAMVKDKSYKDIAEMYSLQAQSRLDASLDTLQNQMNL